jgi:predicted site-specific integrase-resolvase
MAMYPLQKAAAIFGISVHTLRRLLKRYNIKVRIIETDRKRSYITHEDMIILTEHYDNKAREKRMKQADRSKQSAPQEVVSYPENPHELPSPENPEVLFYSVAYAASLLGVGRTTLEHWIAQHQIEKRNDITSSKRTYLSQRDVLMLASLHNCIIAEVQPADTTQKGDISGSQDNTQKQFYSLTEAALALDVSRRTLRNWVLQSNIQLSRIATDGKHMYIARKDVLTLAELHKRKIDSSAIDIFQEVKEMKKKVENIISDIEDIKHDLRIIVKRSIFIG